MVSLKKKRKETSIALQGIALPETARQIGRFRSQHQRCQVISTSTDEFALEIPAIHTAARAISCSADDIIVMLCLQPADGMSF